MSSVNAIPRVSKIPIVKVFNTYYTTGSCSILNDEGGVMVYACYGMVKGVSFYNTIVYVLLPSARSDPPHFLRSPISPCYHVSKIPRAIFAPTMPFNMFSRREKDYFKPSLLVVKGIQYLLHYRVLLDSKRWR
jgi:hypothetical protein